MPELVEILREVSQRCTGAQTPIRLRGLPAITLVTSATLTEPVHYVSEPALALTLQGEKELLLGNRQYRDGAGQYLIVSVNLPIASHIIRACAKQPFFAIVITLKPALIASLLLEAAVGTAPSPVVSGIGVSDANDDLLDVVGRMLRLIDRPNDQAVLGPLVERELCWYLLQGDQARLMQQIGVASGHLARINHAIQWIRNHYDRTIHIHEVAKAAAMSVTSLHRHFRAVTSMSPLQYQKQIRLQEARSQLMSNGRDMANVGFGVGYESPSQFSREYKRYFGVPPAQDAKRMQKILANHQVAAPAESKSDLPYRAKSRFDRSTAGNDRSALLRR